MISKKSDVVVINKGTEVHGVSEKGGYEAGGEEERNEEVLNDVEYEKEREEGIAVNIKCIKPFYCLLDRVWCITNSQIPISKPPAEIMLAKPAQYNESEGNTKRPSQVQAELHGKGKKNDGQEQRRDSPSDGRNYQTNSDEINKHKPKYQFNHIPERVHFKSNSIGHKCNTHETSGWLQTRDRPVPTDFLSLKGG